MLSMARILAATFPKELLKKLEMLSLKDRCF